MNETLGDVIQEALARMKSNGAKPEVIDNATHFAYDYIDSDLLDAHIIPRTNAVVTKKGLDDAAKVLVRTGHQGVAPEIADLWEKTSAYVRNFWRKRVIEVLEEAGIVSVDEVVEVVGESYLVSAGVSCTFVHSGDKLYIKRKEEK